MSKPGLSKFDTSLLSNDEEKHSSSTRKLRQQYLHDTKILSGKIFSSSIQSSTNHNNNPLSHDQSSIDLMSTSLKCDDCQKNDGLFQCCHCNQRLCIRCCNKHYKKVLIELENLHELNDHLLTKVLQIKTDLEKQKNQIIEQCHKWHIDIINKINKAHTLIIQTIHDEYDILDKEYELFIEKEISHINIDKNELIKIKKGNLSSLLSSSITTDSTKTMNITKNHIEELLKHIDDIGKFSFQVKLPTFDIDDTLRVESRFGDITRSTSAIWQNDDYINDIPSNQSEEISKKISSSKQSEINNLLKSSSIKNDYTLNLFDNKHQRIYSSLPTIDKINDNNQYIQLKHEQNQNNDNIINQRKTCKQACRIRRRTTALPLRLSNTDRLSNDYPWWNY